MNHESPTDELYAELLEERRQIEEFRQLLADDLLVCECYGISARKIFTECTISLSDGASLEKQALSAKVQESLLVSQGCGSCAMFYDSIISNFVDFYTEVKDF